MPKHAPAPSEKRFAFFTSEDALSDFVHGDDRAKMPDAWKALNIRFETTITEFEPVEGFPTEGDCPAIFDCTLRMLASAESSGSADTIEIGQISFFRIAPMALPEDLGGHFVDIFDAIDENSGGCAEHLAYHMEDLEQRLEDNWAEQVLLLTDMRVDPRFRGAGIGLLLHRRVQMVVTGTGSLVATMAHPTNESGEHLFELGPDGTHDPAHTAELQRMADGLTAYYLSDDAMGFKQLAPDTASNFLTAIWDSHWLRRHPQPDQDDLGLVLDPGILTKEERVLLGLDDAGEAASHVAIRGAGDRLDALIVDFLPSDIRSVADGEPTAKAAQAIIEANALIAMANAMSHSDLTREAIKRPINELSAWIDGRHGRTSRIVDARAAAVETIMWACAKR
jgi:hypothetical protein